MVALLVLSGCGATGPSAAEVKASEAAAAKKAAQKQYDDDLAAFEQCKSSADPAMRALNAIDSRLSVSVRRDQYRNLVGSAQIKLDEMMQGDGSAGECAGVAYVMNKAAIRHIHALKVWDKCFEDYNCSLDRGSPSDKKMQRDWKATARLMASAARKLAAMEPTAP